MRLINVDALDVEEIPCYYGDQCRIEDVKEWLESAPTIDYAPVKRGTWLGCENYNDIVQCSGCGLIRNIYKQEGWNYCPNCGALMDWEE